ncbi:hypothetical protein VNI00_008547 [Paramarasmius palmivorus]|uniref:F-box domain-containing protein n=1 Tax=Paramarasmius palmivorus TaxID=297713 RepID=A0AAW0CVY6_9AGAR
MTLPPSPFLSKLRTEFFASPAEKVEIHHLISTRWDRLQAIEDEIARLRAEQVELQTFINEHLTLVSPIRKVPIDVLREIFLQRMPENGFPACCALEAPLLFTGICRLWREVAISTPTLWNRIYIHLPAPRPDGQPITEKFLAYLHLWREGVMLWLRRSGTVPLVVSLSSSRSDSRRDEERIHQFHADVVLQLLEHTSRWQNLSLNITHRIWRLLTASTTELSLMKALKVHYDPRITEDPSKLGENHENFVKAVLQRTPSLHKLHLGPLPDNLPIRWDRLTEISLTGWVQGLKISQAVQVLSFSCSSLRYFTANIHIEFVDLPTFSPITLPELQTLNIDVRSMQYRNAIDEPESVLRRFLDCFDAPNLVNFSLRCITPPRRTVSLTDLVGFLESSGCALRSLVLSFLATSAELTELLVGMPSLEQLKLTLETRLPSESEAPEWHLPGMLIDSLTPSQPNTDVLCPNLEFLVFQRCPASYALPIIALAEARCAEDSSTQKLKRLQLHVEHAIDDTEVISRVDALRNQGMLVKFLSATDTYAKLVTTSPKPDFCEYVHSGDLWWPIDDV